MDGPRLGDRFLPALPKTESAAPLTAFFLASPLCPCLVNLLSFGRSQIRSMERPMRRLLTFAILVLIATAANAQSKLSPKWEELTSADFVQALAQAKNTCLLPVGIIEKHGPHLPLGNDLINVRAAVFASTPKEYAVV